ncbi:8091_t:CDS:2, partial [Rhizophagus irregularis]
IEATHEITSWEIDALYSAQSKLMEKNRSLRDQLELEKNNKVDPQPLPMNDSSHLGPEATPSTLNPSQIISVGGAEAVPLLTTAPIVTSSSIPPITYYDYMLHG